MNKYYYKYLLPLEMWQKLRGTYEYGEEEIPTRYNCKFLEVGIEDDKHKVDVIWSQDEPAEFTRYRVIPTTHDHWFAGGESMELWYKSNNRAVPKEVKDMVRLEKFKGKGRR